MDINHLRYFALAAELEHITKAADQLMVSQPFLTKIINQLEEELEVNLFDHIGRNIRLNEYGRKYYIRVKGILRELENAKTEILEMSGRAKLTITIVTNTAGYMPSLLARFHKTYPDLTIVQISSERNQIVKALQTGAADYALSAPPLEEDKELSIRTEVVMRDEALVLFSPGHPLRGKSRVSVADIEQQNLITAPVGYGIRDGLDIHFKRRGVHPQIVIETNDTSAIPDYVQAGLGYGCLSRALMSQAPELLKECSEFIETDIDTAVALSWCDKQYKTKTHLLFHKFLKDYFAELEKQYR